MGAFLPLESTNANSDELVRIFKLRRPNTLTFIDKRQAKLIFDRL